MTIRKWKRTRFWAIFDQDGELVVVCVYLAGAMELKARLEGSMGE